MADYGTLIPQAPKTIMEVMLGKSMFTGNAIVPTNLQQLLPEEQYTSMTSSVAKGIGRIITQIDKLAGEDNRWISQKLQSPCNIDYVIKGFAGTLGKRIVELIDYAGEVTGVTKKDAPYKDLSMTPITKEFIARFPAYASGTTDAFYKQYEKYKQRYLTVRHLVKLGKADALQRAQELATQAPIIKLSMVEKAMTNISVGIREIERNENLNGYEKRQLIDSLLVRRVQIAENGIKLLHQFQELWEAGRGE